MTEQREDLLFAEHVLRAGYATEAQVQEARAILARLRGEMELDESLANVLEKKGFLTATQRQQAERALDPAQGAANGNAIPGYQLLERVGFGAMGSVYKARHLDLDIPVAVKVLRQSLASSRTQVERLKREARLVARLTHPNIVLSRDVGEANGLHFLVMEYVEGETVRARLDAGPMDEAEALRIVLETARALQHAHEHGVIHRDVKPGNIMIARDGRIKLADFGLARGKAPSDLTMEHASLGTPQYVAPEQMRRAADATARSDLFGLGASLYHMVTGRPPFTGESLGEIVQKVMLCEFPPPEKVNPDLSNDTLYLIHRLMRGDPARRYPDAATVVADLERLLEGESIAPGSFQGDHAAYLRRRRRTMALAGGGLAVLTLLLAVWGFTAWKETQREQERLERCRILGRTAIDAAPADADAVRELARRIDEAWHEAGALDCGRASLRGLERRRARTEADARALDEADDAFDDVTAAGADPAALPFAALHRAVEAARDRAHHEATKARLDDVARRIERESAQAAERRWRALASADHAGPDAALRALKAYRDDLQQRYVGGRGGPAELGDAVARYEGLIRRWRRIGEEYDPDLAEAEREQNWTAAHRLLEALRREKSAAREGLELPAGLMRFFPLPAGPSRLEKDERAEFAALETETDRLVAEGRRTAALARIRAFEDRAHVTTARAAELRRGIERSRTAQEKRETELLDRLRTGFEDALRGRRWLEPSRLIDSVDAGVVVQREREFARLRERADRLRRLAGLLGGPPGADADPAALRARAEKALEEAGDGAASLHATFLAAEAFAAGREHARAIALLDEALERGGDDPGLRRERKRRVQARAADQDAALELLAQVREDRRARRYSVALTACEALLDRYRFTNAVRGTHAELRRLRRELRSYAGDETLRLRAGLPRGGLARDAESGELVLRWTFEEWWPAEAPAGAPDPGKARAEIRERVLRAHGHETAEQRDRAARQLSRFSANLRAAEDGVARFRPPATEEEALGATRWRAEGVLEPVSWSVPDLDLAKDWTVVVEVSWEGPPGYFVLAAGRFQGGVLYAPGLAGRGGGVGARVFADDSLENGLEKRFETVLERGGRKADMSLLEGLEPGAAPRIRLRLRRKGRKIYFAISKGPLALDGKDGKGDAGDGAKVVEMELRVHGRRTGPDGFRFASLRRFRLHEVAVKGTLAR